MFSEECQARSGGIPRECPLPNRIREFFPDWPWSQADIWTIDFVTCRLRRKFPSSSRVSRRTLVRGTMYGKNFPSRHGAERCLGIPPLRATDFGWEQRFLRRSGRDDTCIYFPRGSDLSPADRLIAAGGRPTLGQGLSALKLVPRHPRDPANHWVSCYQTVLSPLVPTWACRSDRKPVPCRGTW